MSGPKNNKNQLIIFGAIILVILSIPEALVHRHPHFGLEATPLFFPILGILAAAVLILLAGLLRMILGRKEDYYDG